MSRRTDGKSPGQEIARYRLILFVAGDEVNSCLARGNLADICEHELGGACDTTVIDVLTDPASAVKHQILVTPTLLVLGPVPPVTVIGNLSDRERLRLALRLGD